MMKNMLKSKKLIDSNVLPKLMFFFQLMEKPVKFSGNTEFLGILYNCLSAGGPKSRDGGAGDV